MQRRYAPPKCLAWQVCVIHPRPLGFACTYLQVPSVLKLLLERLRNEITRLPAVKAFAILAHSPLELGLAAHLDATMVRQAHATGPLTTAHTAETGSDPLRHHPPASHAHSMHCSADDWPNGLLVMATSPLSDNLLPPTCCLFPLFFCPQSELTSFLRKANRQLRQASLVALEALVAKYGAQLAPDALAALVPETATLVSDAGMLCLMHACGWVGDWLSCMGHSWLLMGIVCPSGVG